MGRWLEDWHVGRSPHERDREGQPEEFLGISFFLGISEAVSLVEL